MTSEKLILTPFQEDVASDLDLAILTKNPLPLTTFSQLAEAFENSDLTFKVDLVDWHRITDEFRAHIELRLVRKR